MNLFTLPPVSSPRIFGIGFNKTGTTTLGKCFDILGLGPVGRPQSLHDAFADVTVPIQGSITSDRDAFFKTFPYRAICREVFDYGNYGLALHAANGFRAFHDRPWNVGDFYKVLDQLFLGSFFILTTRDADSWWNSVEHWLNVTHASDDEKRYRYLKHLGVIDLNKESCISAYLSHNENIRDYFSSRQKSFLELNMTVNFDWESLCDFLKLPVPNHPFPHQNQQQYK